MRSPSLSDPFEALAACFEILSSFFDGWDTDSILSNQKKRGSQYCEPRFFNQLNSKSALSQTKAKLALVSRCTHATGRTISKESSSTIRIAATIAIATGSASRFAATSWCRSLCSLTAVATA
jgi:hypothetical protein